MLLKEEGTLKSNFLQLWPLNFIFETSNDSLCDLQLLTG